MSVKDRLRSWLGGAGVTPRKAGSPLAAPDPAALPDTPPPGLAGSYSRHSHGLEQFLASIRSVEPLSILDVGGLNQANVAFLTELGHKLYSEDLLRSWEDAAGEWAPEPEPDLMDGFLRSSLGFPEASLDGVLLWDTLEFVPPALLRAAVDRLHFICKPGAYLLAFFHAEEKAAEVPTYSYRIHDASTLVLARRRMRAPTSLFNNRSVEKLFQRYQSVKFFLTRDHLREVIVRR